jgi:His/Glu/Gln/Arg/opine family amino acid ABC transporter permease subunit
LNYHFDWRPIWERRDLLVEGLAMTVAVSATALLLALIIGTLIGTAGARRSRSARLAAALYVEGARNVPLLIHIYFWYIGLAVLRLPAFACAVLGLATYSSAYVAEVVRGGIGSVPRGQMQAALASGLTRGQALRYVIYPQVLRIIAPSLASLFSQLIKDSSLASVIAVAELAYAAGSIEGETFRSFEIYITIALLYIGVVTLTTQAVLLVPGARSRASAGIADA